jgi:hypothetical protein
VFSEDYRTARVRGGTPKLKFLGELTGAECRMPLVDNNKEV